MLENFATPVWFLLLTLIFWALITGRYFVFAGITYLIFYIWYPQKWIRRKINSKKSYKPGQLRQEIKWSLVSSILFSVAGSLAVILWQKGYTRVYTRLTLYGYWYLPVSLIVFMLAHETYYYWLHRWMHRPGVFRLVHKVHHDSNVTSPFTAFSFHPLEGLLQAIFLPLMLLVLPMHYYVIIALLLVMTVSSVVNHLDIEIYPRRFNRTWIGRWIIGASHHSLHHKQFRYNYGLYFTFWDKVGGTESPVFDSLFDSVTGPAPESNRDISSQET